MGKIKINKAALQKEHYRVFEMSGGYIDEEGRAYWVRQFSGNGIFPHHDFCQYFDLKEAECDEKWVKLTASIVLDEVHIFEPAAKKATKAQVNTVLDICKEAKLPIPEWINDAV